MMEIKSPIEDAVEEAKEEITEAIEELKETVEEAGGEVTLAELKACIDKIAEELPDKIYDKVKAFVLEVLDAATDAAEAVEETAATATAPVEETAAPVETEEDVEDVKPRQGHKLFKKPLKRDN